MMITETVHPPEEGTVTAFFVVDNDYNGERRETDALHHDIESTIPPWICVLGAFAFAVPSFGKI
jgi:hypothetical protein